LPQVKLMPTGGRDRSRTPATGSAPVRSAVGVGTSLLDAKAIATVTSTC
jgi:2-keto-3-deoxy-6-phosphogluconate aldolase